MNGHGIFLCRRGSAFRHRVYFWLEGFTRFVINGHGIFCAEGAPHFVIFCAEGAPHFANIFCAEGALHFVIGYIFG